MKKAYRQLKQYGETVFVEKKSEFISYAMPVFNEAEALEFLNKIRKKHYDANHNCYAYIIGESSEIQRSSDDGEPSGTAGLPILEVLRKEGLTNTIIIVTRYFGGIMLGSGGLIRAYSEGASNAVKACGALVVKPFSTYLIHVEYSYISKLQYELPKRSYIIHSIDYLDTAAFKVLAGADEGASLEQQVMDWTNGNVLVEFLGIEMHCMDEETNQIILPSS